MTVPTGPASSIAASQSCILYQSNRITLVDIPRSISAAQGTPQFPCLQNILSCPALTSPFPSNEPKSDAARARLQAKKPAAQYEGLYTSILSKALLVIHDAYQGEWCLPRSHSSVLPTAGKKRKASDVEHVAQADGARVERPQHTASQEHIDTQELDETSHLLHDLAANGLAGHQQYDLQWNDASNPDVNTSASVPATKVASDLVPWAHYLHNHTLYPRTLEVSRNNLQPTKFIVPPSASCFLGDCAKSSQFHHAVRKQAEVEGTCASFDIVMMDPPWPNASVTRSRGRAKSGYQTSPTMWDIRQLIFETDVNVLLAKGGLLGIWITNKPSVRELVLGEDGLFDSWDVDLEEEWLWIKTTKSGDSVTTLDSFWRKPYEVFLLGRKRGSTADNVGEASEVTRRVIAGVPDLHSRKPCLKELIEPLMPDASSYRALEVFARYLVAGWWSWGNEALKFNNKHCWNDVE